MLELTGQPNPVGLTRVESDVPKPVGSTEQVTVDTFDAYEHSVHQKRMVLNVELQLQAVKKGLDDVVPINLISDSVSWNELQQLWHGDKVRDPCARATFHFCCAAAGCVNS